MEWSWESFLLPLRNGDLTCHPSPRSVTFTPQFLSSHSLVRRFSRDLQRQDLQKMEEKRIAVASAEATLRSLFQFGRVDLKELGRKWKTYQRALNSNSDRDSSGSAWTIEILQKYIQRSDIVCFQPCPSLFAVQEAQYIRDKVALSLAALCGNQGNGIDENLLLFHGMRDSTEGDSRMILEAILQPLCAAKGLALRCEQSLTCNDLPDNRFDYIMYYNNQPLGFVEAKSQHCIKDQSVVQLIVQLLLLSAEDSHGFRFGVLSDARRFILAGVSQNKVVFFQKDIYPIRIRYMESEADLLSIANEIAWLIDLAVYSRQTNRSIEECLSQVNDVCYEVQGEFFFPFCSIL